MGRDDGEGGRNRSLNITFSRAKDESLEFPDAESQSSRKSNPGVWVG